MEDKFIKNFCRLITKEKLDGSDITKFFNVVNSLAGDLKGSVFADDSTILVDAVNGKNKMNSLTQT